MHWQTKSLDSIVLGPIAQGLSHPLYYRFQRHLGALRRDRIDPTSRLLFGMEICRQITSQGHSPCGRARFSKSLHRLRLNLPIACWLCGADRVRNSSPTSIPICIFRW